MKIPLPHYLKYALKLARLNCAMSITSVHRQPSIMAAGNTLPILTLMVMIWSIYGKAELYNATSIIATEISK